MTELPEVLPDDLPNTHPLNSPEWNDGRYNGGTFQREYPHVGDYRIVVEALETSLYFGLYDYSTSATPGAKDVDEIASCSCKPDEGAARSALERLARTGNAEHRHDIHSVIEDASHDILETIQTSLGATRQEGEDRYGATEICSKITFLVIDEWDTDPIKLCVVLERDTNCRRLADIGSFFEALEQEIDDALHRLADKRIEICFLNAESDIDGTAFHSTISNSDLNEISQQ